MFIGPVTVASRFGPYLFYSSSRDVPESGNPANFQIRSGIRKNFARFTGLLTVKKCFQEENSNFKFHHYPIPVIRIY